MTPVCCCLKQAGRALHPATRMTALALFLVSFLAAGELLASGDESAEKESAKDESAKTESSAPVKYSRPPHKAVGARIVVSSTHRGEQGERNHRALVDGDLSTRWSSDYVEPQEVKIILRQRVDIHRIRIHWERACATKYLVSVSPNGKTWQKAYLYLDLGAEPVPRIDTIRLPGTSTRAIKIELMARVRSEWGFSIHEIEVLDQK